MILADKAKIEAVIEELDVKKTTALQSTWIKVNRDFGSIFSMLLPGTQAKLEPPEGQSVTDGTEKLLLLLLLLLLLYIFFSFLSSLFLNIVFTIFSS